MPPLPLPRLLRLAVLTLVALLLAAPAPAAPAAAGGALVRSLADLRQRRPSLDPAGHSVFLEGYRRRNDGGGGLFLWDADSAAPDDGGMVVAIGPGRGRWCRVADPAERNVRWFGAVGDGAADDTDALQRAIDSLGDAGGAVDLSNGTYRITRPVQLRSGLILRGGLGARGNRARTGTIRVDGEHDGLVFAPTELTYANLQLEGLTIEGDAKRHRRGSGLVVNRGHDVVLRQVTIGLMPEDGFRILKDCWAVSFDNCYAGTNTRYGYYLAAQHVRVDGCAADGGLYSLAVDGGGGSVEVGGFNFEGAKVAAFGLFGGSTIRLHDGVAQHMPVAVTDGGGRGNVHPTRRVQIRGNRFWGTNTAGSTAIQLLNPAGAGFMIADNFIFNFAEGIVCRNGGSNLLTQNHVSVNGGPALRMAMLPGAKPSVVTGGLYAGPKGVVHDSPAPTQYVGVSSLPLMEVRSGMPMVGSMIPMMPPP